MQSFSYQRPTDVASAVAAGQATGARFIGGGTNLLDLMKGGVERPLMLVDITQLPLAHESGLEHALPSHSVEPLAVLVHSPFVQTSSVQVLLSLQSAATVH